MRPTAEGPPVVMSLNPATLQQLSAYVDGELTPSEREGVERALAADPRLQEVERALRGLGAVMRAATDAEVARADFSGLSERVLGRVRARSPGLLERFREVWRRPWIPVGGLVAVAAAALFLLRPVAPSAPGVLVESARSDTPSQTLQPVVLKTESGDAIIWLVEHPDASTNHRATPLPPDKPGLQAPVPAQQQRPRAGEL